MPIEIPTAECGWPSRLMSFRTRSVPYSSAAFAILIVGQVGAVLEDVVAGPGVNLAEVVVRPLRKRDLFRRLHSPHLHQDIADFLEPRLGKDALHPLELFRGGRFREPDPLVAESALLDAPKLPLHQVHGGTRNHRALIGVSALRVREVVVVVAVGEPPAAHQRFVEARIEPVHLELACGNEAGERALGSGEEEAGQIDDVPGVA